MKKTITLKKTISAVLSAVTLSTCVVLPTSVNQSSGKVSLVNPIIADASVNTTYTKYTATGVVNVALAKMYMYDNNRKKFVSYEAATGKSSNVVMGTAVGILGVKGDYYLVSDALNGMWMKKSEIIVLKTVATTTTTTTTTKKPTTTTTTTTKKPTTPTPPLPPTPAADTCHKHKVVTKQEERWVTETVYAVYDVKRCTVCKEILEEKYRFCYDKMIGPNYPFNIY